LFALRATWVSSQLKQVFYYVARRTCNKTRVSIDYSSKSHAKQATQACI